MKLTNRGIHRDVAYFYVGLIIAFSLSGIILNHRQDWYPMDYTYESEEVSVDLSQLSDEPSEEAVLKISEQWELQGAYRNHRVRNNELRIFYNDGVLVNISMENGNGLLERTRKVPLVGHSMYLHKSTNKAWIWYSDIFGAAMLLIAITGLFIPTGNKGFRNRGWKLMAVGLLFPLLFLFVIS